LALRYNGATVRIPRLALAALPAVATMALFCLAACGGHAPSPPVSVSPITPSASAAPLPSASAKTYDVRSFGATGNGTSDDAGAIQRALREAAKVRGTVYLPAGTYLCSTPLTLPDSVRLAGEGDTSWLKGELIFASSDSIEKLRIGAVGRCAVTNADNADGTTFTDCRFHGGGSSAGVNSSVVYLGGPQGNVSHVLFVRCQIERTSYVPPHGVNTYADGVGNTITIHEFCYLPDSGHVEHITFQDCHLGASNGHATGALRMMMEAFTWDNHTGRVYHGWKDLTFDGCTIEASDTGGLDFADKQISPGGQHSSSGVLINGCTFLGAARSNSGYGGLPITYECPTGIVITNNTFYATPHQAIGGSHVGTGVRNAPGLLVQGNIFDMTRSPVGLTHDTGSPCINLVGFGSRVIDNDFVYDAGLGVVIEADVSPAVGNLIEGNTFTDRRSSGGEPTIEFVDDHSAGNHGNHVASNTITNHAAGAAGVIAQTGGGPNYVAGNTFLSAGSTPFVVQSGTLVHTGNQVR